MMMTADAEIALDMFFSSVRALENERRMGMPHDEVMKNARLVAEMFLSLGRRGDGADAGLCGCGHPADQHDLKSAAEAIDGWFSGCVLCNCPRAVRDVMKAPKRPFDSREGK